MIDRGGTMFEDAVEDEPLYKDTITFLNDFYKEYGDKEFKFMISYINELITEMRFVQEKADTHDIYLIKVNKKNAFKVITVNKNNIEKIKKEEKNIILTVIKNTLKIEDNIISVYTDMKGLQEELYVQNCQDSITIH